MEHLTENPDKWRVIENAQEPYKQDFPQPFTNIDKLVKMVIISCIRPDKVIHSIQVSILYTFYIVNILYTFYIVNILYTYYTQKHVIHILYIHNDDRLNFLVNFTH